MLSLATNSNIFGYGLTDPLGTAHLTLEDRENDTIDYLSVKENTGKNDQRSVGGLLNTKSMKCPLSRLHDLLQRPARHRMLITIRVLQISRRNRTQLSQGPKSQ